jgi:amidohydrolase
LTAVPGGRSSASVDDVLDAFLARHGDELVAFRRLLHAHPERSHEERATTAAVAQRLEAAGLAPRVLWSGTGLVCDVDAGAGGPARSAPRGPIVALRADIDALAMEDEKDVPYRSQTAGVAHACGHDVHTTIVLGCGLVLADVLHGARARGRVRLLFQPAEETVPGGALDVIAQGGLDGAGWVFGLHCDPKLDVGKVGVRAGPITSAADVFEVRLHGPGGHTARPHLTVDLVTVAARIATELPARVRARQPELDTVFGALRAGDAANVVPSFAVLRGTVRTGDRAAWAEAPDLIHSLLAEIVAGEGPSLDVDYGRGAPPVENHPQATALLAAAARRALGPDAVVPTPQSMGGDDFSWYLERVRGAYARLGVHDPVGGPALDLHASTFDVDERCIAAGVRVLAHTAIDALVRG